MVSAAKKGCKEEGDRPQGASDNRNFDGDIEQCFPVHDKDAPIEKKSTKSYKIIRWDRERPYNPVELLSVSWC